MQIRLEGRIVLITGATGGIGRAAAERFADCGATIVAHYRNDQPDLQDWLRCLPGEGHTAVKADFLKREDIEAMFETVKTEYNRLDVLVNNAGYCPRDEFLSITNDSLDNTFQVNFMAPFICAREAGKLMRDQGGGKILFVASVDGDRPGGARAHYASSKAAEIQLMRNIAMELAPYHILVNAVSPGAIDSPMTSKVKEDASIFEHVLKGIPLRRFGEPQEIASMLAFLASDYSNYTTGANLTIDGGLSLMRGY